MPVRTNLKFEELTPRTKQTAVSTLPELEEFLDGIEKLAPYTGSELVLPQSKERGRKHQRQNIKNRVREYLKNLHRIMDFELNAFGKDGNDVIQVKYIPAMVKNRKH